jgi:outer membrane assembly lipoprotein YfiO
MSLVRLVRTRRALSLAGLLVVASLLGCAGSIPSIPDTPEAILAKADSYFNRHKYFQATELYKGFLSRHPGHDRSDYAQYRLAESYFKDGDYTLASVEYQLVISNYGYSDYVDDALFQIGLCFWRDDPKVERDQQKAHDALSRFQQFLTTYPSSPLVPEAREYVKKIQARLAEKAFISVRWYYRTKKYDAVIIYCDKIIDNYPDNEYWARAHYYKGLALLQKGQREEAAGEFSQVLGYPEEVAVKQQARERLASMRRK